MTVSLQARNIVRLARKQKMKIARGGLGRLHNRPAACALAVLRDEIGSEYSIYDREFSDELGVSFEKLMGLESGFEGRVVETAEPYRQNADFRRYYKVGERVAKLAGLGA
jgi:hypothetical protein